MFFHSFNTIAVVLTNFWVIIIWIMPTFGIMFLCFQTRSKLCQHLLVTFINAQPSFSCSSALFLTAILHICGFFHFICILFAHFACFFLHSLLFSRQSALGKLTVKEWKCCESYLKTPGKSLFYGIK